MVEKICDGETVLAIIVSNSFREPGIHFFTPDSYSQQLGYLHHPAGKTIPPHLHNPVSRSVDYTCEVLMLKKGRMRVDFYNQNKEFICDRELGAGDAILLIRGGHGFEVLEEVEMFEVKQGPFTGDGDKTRFEPAPT